MGSLDRENLYQVQDIEGSSSAVTTPGDVMTTTTSVQLDTPTTPLPPPSPRTEQVIFLDDHLHISDALGFEFKLVQLSADYKVNFMLRLKHQNGFALKETLILLCTVSYGPAQLKPKA